MLLVNCDGGIDLEGSSVMVWGGRAQIDCCRGQYEGSKVQG